ncbi:MAG: hypothetical protein U0132_22310 [Gemmatimonadaceae bacterium]
MFRRIATSFLLLLATASLLSAQEGGRRGRGRGRIPSGVGGSETPSNWASIGLGFMEMAQVHDGNSNSLWDFGQGFPITFTVEHEIAAGVTAGFAGSYTRMPLVYAGASSTCGTCDAHATVATYGANFHGGAPNGGDTGLYQTFDLFLGAMQFGSFEQDASKEPLPPAKSNRDFLFSVGYGFGYGLARDWRLELLGEYMSSVHERDNLAGNAQTLARHFMVTFALRVGF